MSNQEIRDKAIQIVKRFEKKKGRTAREPENAKKSGYDLKSGKRKIEVKGTSKSNPFQSLVLSSREQRDVFKNGGYIYRVTDINDAKSKLFIFREGDIGLVPEPRWRVRKIRKVVPQ
jgi:hypothetical protein